MDPILRRQQAEKLLSEVKGILVDADVFSWPWQPFKTPCDEELRDRERRQIVGRLSKETDPEERLSLAESLVELGGYEIDGGDLEILRSQFHLYEHWRRLEKFWTIEEFEQAFIELPWWKGGEPDWGKLRHELVLKGIVRITELEDLTLVDIRRGLLPLQVAMQSENLPGVTERVPPAETQTTQRPPKKRLQRRPSMRLSKKQLEAVDLKAQGLTPPQIAERLGITLQAVHQRLQAAKPKVAAMAKGSRSVSSRTGIEDYDLRKHIRRSSDL